MKRTHVITGATGFVGAALVLELLQRTDDWVIAIVRPGERSPEERLHASLVAAAAAYDLGPQASALKRCTGIAGNLTEPECGVRGDIDAHPIQFWHCAASLQYESRYVDEIRAANVEGTRHALSLAARLKADTFNYVSTAYVAGKAAGVIPEVPVTEVDTNNAYERSKVDAEHLVRAATALRWRILRPSIVVGHSRTMAATAFSGYYGFIRQLVQFRGVTNRAQAGLLERTPLRLRMDPDVGLNLVPVDEVAADAVRIGLSDEAGGVFHLTHPSPPSVGLVIRTIFRAVGIAEPVFVPNRDEFQWLDKRFDDRIGFYGSYLIGDKRFDWQRSDAFADRGPGAMLSFDQPTMAAFTQWYVAHLEKERAHLPVRR